jgi:hypothetical protein
MPARPALQVTSLIFIAIGLFVLVSGLQLRLFDRYGPGAGMFPALIGGGLALAGLVWLLQLSFGAAGRDLAPIDTDRAGLVRVGLTLAALLIFAALLPLLGFKLAMLLLLLAMLLGFKWEHVPLKIVLAIACSFGLHYVFEAGLRVPLPYSALPALRALGL